MNGVLLQVFEDGSSSYEVNKIFQASLTYDIPRLKCQLSDLRSLRHLLRSYLPVGTVEFVQEAMRILDCEPPPWNCYPDILRPFLRRNVLKTTKGAVDLSQDIFVKPAEHLKAFTGFLLQSVSSERQAFDLLPDSTPIWTAEKVQFLSEYRYYVTGEGDLSRGRYDDGEDEAPEPDEGIVGEMARSLFSELQHPFALDVGVLNTGPTALVEVNDAWAIGLYENALSPSAYYLFLLKRWDRIKSRA